MPLTRFFVISARIIAILVIINLLWWIRPVLVYLWELAKEVLLPFFIGLIVAYLLHPVVASLERRNVPRMVAVLLIYTLFVLVTVIGLLNAIPLFVRQFAELSDDLPRLTEWYYSWLNEWEAHKYFLPDTIQSGVDRVIIQSQEKMSLKISKLAESARQSAGKLLAFAVVPFIAFYFLKDIKVIQRSLMGIIPRSHRRRTFIVLQDIHETLGKYLHGQMVVALLVGVAAYFGYWLIGLPYPFLLAAIISLTNVIPYIGPLIGAFPAMLIALTISVKMLLMVIMVNLIIQVVEGNILSPHIVGKNLHLHPLLIMFALLLGEALGGIIGLIFAVPVLAIAKTVITRVAMLVRES